tara:strand:- start:3037 stop:4437 length:1401 start_codon:yes stop_codon:yes gene_type:complete
MPQYFGNLPNIDLISQASEVKAAFDESKIGSTPNDVQSLAWGFLQSNFEKPMEDLVVANIPRYTSAGDSHPAVIPQGQQQPGQDPSPGGGGGGVGGNHDHSLNCNDVCDCLPEGTCGSNPQGACCLPEGSTVGDGICVFVTGQQCASFGGVWQRGVSCGNANCVGEETNSSTCDSPGCSEDSKTTQESTSEESGSSSSFDFSFDVGGPPDTSEDIPDIIDDPYPGIEDNVYKPDVIGKQTILIYGGGDPGCVDPIQGGTIIINPGDIPEERAFGIGKKCCPEPDCEPCNESCLDSRCWETLPTRIVYPVETYIECPCGPNETIPGWDFPQSPWEYEQTPGGLRWKFTIPGGCCCAGEIPDTDDPPTAFSEPSYSTVPGPGGIPELPTGGDGGTVCITVVWGRTYSGGQIKVPQPEGCDLLCQVNSQDPPVCLDCIGYLTSEQYTAPTLMRDECFECCDQTSTEQLP